MSTDNKNVVVNPGTEGVAAKLRTNKRKVGGILASAMAVLLAGALAFSGLQTAFAAIPGSGNGATLMPARR